MAVLGAILRNAGVALLVLTPNAALDPVGVAAGSAGAVLRRAGTVQADPQVATLPVPLLTFTARTRGRRTSARSSSFRVFDPANPDAYRNQCSRPGCGSA